MKKTTLLMILSLVLAVALGVGSTMAYLTDTDADVNVMVMGDVEIVQNEQQRIEQGNADLGLEEFEQYKTLLPYVTIGATTKEDVKVGDYTIQMRDESVKNYVDKIVTVTNTGNNDAFVRTIIAIPTGGYELHAANTQWLHYNVVSDTDTDPNNGWYYGKNSDVLNELLIAEDGTLPAKEYVQDWAEWDKVDSVEINGIDYKLIVVTNKDVLKPGETTGPNLVGLYLDSRVDKDDEGYFIMVDGEKHRIAIDDPANLQVLVATQAVQAGGFEDAGAWYALDSAFGNITTDNHPWSNGMPEVGSPGEKWDTNEPPNMIYNVEQLRQAMKNGGNYKLGSDLRIEELQSSGFGAWVTTDCKLDLNGHDIEMCSEQANQYGIFYVSNSATLDIVGSGDIKLTKGDTPMLWVTDGGTVNIHGGNWSDEVAEVFANPSEGIYANKNATINVYSGTFNWERFPEATFNIRNGAGSTINLYGGSVKADEGFIYGHNDESFLADGYKLQETVDANGDVWQTVVPE